MIETFTDFDPAEYLSTPEAIVEFMRDTQETGDTSYIDKAIEVVARAKERTELSRECPMRKRAFLPATNQHAGEQTRRSGLLGTNQILHLKPTQICGPSLKSRTPRPVFFIFFRYIS
ncbi:helix-turn-helix domain-containing transcriptional regulator [Pseudomonas kilonensis]|uniref:helix-turn-helix domain-containing transcriptional regulator n=1 Tax=Pseudomonas kilonensis TaxID=132476 RepID=UPI000944C84D|nr:hypothetical protein [Pseudomonas kilonensis]